MGSKAIKVSEETYEYLKGRSAEELLSIKEVVDRMARERGDLEDFAGSWEMSDEEAEEIRRRREGGGPRRGAAEADAPLPPRSTRAR